MKVQLPTTVTYSQGAIEMLVAGSLCGLTYAMFSGQPLTIIGATGPLLIFETILYQLAMYVCLYVCECVSFLNNIENM